MPQMACQAFATREDVLDAACGCELTDSEHGALIDELIDDATDMLYVLSGGRVFGRCTRTVRPYRRGSTMPSEWATTTGWGLDSGLDSIPLRGPDTEIMEVVVDGAVLNPSEYGLLDGNKLFRKSGCWPSTNDLTKDDSQDGTFSVTFRFGRTPSYLTRSACVEMVCMMARDEPRALSRMRGIVSANVQGVSVQLDDDEVRSLGLAHVNRFLDAYSPRGITVLGVYSPEVDHGWTLHTVTGGSGS
jgi:hypothetical protein